MLLELMITRIVLPLHRKFLVGEESFESFRGTFSTLESESLAIQMGEAVPPP